MLAESFNERVLTGLKVALRFAEAAQSGEALPLIETAEGPYRKTMDSGQDFPGRFGWEPFEDEELSRYAGVLAHVGGRKFSTGILLRPSSDLF